MARQNPHDQQLVDALRAWHRWEHGDQVGAMQEAAAGVDVPDEWRHVFEAQEVAATAWNHLNRCAQQYGYASPEFHEAAQMWSLSIQDLTAALQDPGEAEPEPAPARRRGGGAPPSAAARNAAAQKAAGVSMQGFATQPAMSPTGNGGPMSAGGTVLAGQGQDLGNGVVMGPVPIAGIHGLPPSMAKP